MSQPEPSENHSSKASRENPPRKRPVSERRIQANRRNAQRSTGPKTARGKDIAARNSFKHGLLASSAVITLGPAKEKKAEFDALLSGLRDYFGPVGAVEEVLVEEIAVSYWKEKRAQLYENGEVLRRLHNVVGHELRNEADYEEGINDLLPAYEGDNQRLLTSSQGLEYVLGFLAKVREEVETAGQASAESLKQLSEFCGGDWESVGGGKSGMLAELGREKQRLGRLRKKVGRVEREERAAKLQGALLPYSEPLEVLLRYSAANERRRYRALAQLVRLQRQRSGEAVPPPIDVQVTSDGSDFTKRSQ